MGNSHELATVIDNFLPALQQKRKLPTHKLKAIEALQKCRTDFMGGHVEACEDCGTIRMAYNSCRNRHCPKCGSIDKEKWIINREADLLPVKYFHVVFTVPDKLNNLFLNNQVTMYNLLFTVAWNVLKDFGNTHQWIGGKIGAIAILHTSGQNLHYHPHLHFIVPAGALMRNGKWKHSRSKGKFLFDVKQLSPVFRARFVEEIRSLKQQKKIQGSIPNNLFEKNWVVYAKKAFGGPSKVINYLGRYTHRTAISNDRILHVDSREVTFIWKDYRNKYKKQVTTLPGEEFLRLFTMHILPQGFTRIRHFGFLSSASKKKSLALIRNHLKAWAPIKLEKSKIKELALQKMNINPGYCKCCGGIMKTIEIIPNKFHSNQRAPPYTPLEEIVTSWKVTF